MRVVAILLYCYLAIFAFGQLTRVTLEIPEVNIHLVDILVGLAVSSWLLTKLVKREKFTLPPLTNPILLFFLLAAVSLAVNTWGNRLSGREMIVSWLYLLRWGFYAGVYFVVYDLAKKHKRSIKNWLIGAGLGSAVLGLLQYLILPDTRFLEDFGWDPHYYRVIGTFLDPGFLGAILVLTLTLIVISYINISYKLGVKRWLLLLAGLTVYLALALTYSRASYLAYLASMGTIAWFKKSPKFFLAVLAFLLVTISLLPRPGGEGVRLERESTIKFRLINWGQSLEIAKDHPLFGVGFNAYRYAQRDYSYLDFANWRASHAGGGADSSFLFVLATTGLFGFLAYLWLWGKIILLGKKEVLILATVLALLVHSVFVNSLFYPWIMGWMWILLGTAGVKD